MNIDDRVFSRFESAVKNDNVSHAYILEGSYTVDKIACAKRMAKTLLCSNMGCDQCSVCKKIDRNEYEDLYIIGPESNSVKDSDIENIQNRLKVKPFVGNRNIVIISKADTMTRWAQNRLLKTLEEPPEGAVIILLADNIEYFLQTVISRCVIYRLEASGEYGRNNDAFELAKKIEELIYEESCFYQILDYVKKFSKDKNEILRMLDHLEVMYRDYLLEGSRYGSNICYNSIYAIEAAKNKVMRNMNISYALKEMILKIGG